jgi:hypothetical protein
VVNKDSENAALQSFLDKERDRREAETTQLKKMLTVEQERAINAIREAEQNSTKISMFQKNAEAAEQVIKTKDAKIDNLMK